MAHTVTVGRKQNTSLLGSRKIQLRNVGSFSSSPQHIHTHTMSDLHVSGPLGSVDIDQLIECLPQHLVSTKPQYHIKQEMTLKAYKTSAPEVEAVTLGYLRTRLKRKEENVGF